MTHGAVINFDNSLPTMPRFGDKANLEEMMDDPGARIKHYRYIEALVRNSMEYRNYVRFLKDEVGLTSCTILSNISKTTTPDVTIEMHHYPFCLMDIVDAVFRRRCEENESVSSMAVAGEVVELHYRNLVGLVPLTTTMHELYHNGKLQIDMRSVFGDVRAFAIAYQRYLPAELAHKLKRYVKASIDGSVQRANSRLLSVSPTRVVIGGGTMHKLISTTEEE